MQLDSSLTPADARLAGYLEAWKLGDPQLVTSTATSRIYTVIHKGERVILKLLAPGETEEPVGALALRYFDGHGAVRLFNSDGGAHLLEYAGGDDLAGLVHRGDDEGATCIIADVIRELHSVGRPLPEQGLFSLDRWFRELFVKAAADRMAGIDSIYIKGAAITERLLADQRDIRVLHGDIHHGNIRQSPRGWLAFDPKGLVGERTYDCANTFCNPPIPGVVQNENRLLTTAGILAEELKLNYQRLLDYAFAYACLSASWSFHRGGEEVVWALGVAEIAEKYAK
jgi:streptomycin 6-kinase